MLRRFAETTNPHKNCAETIKSWLVKFPSSGNLFPETFFRNLIHVIILFRKACFRKPLLRGNSIRTQKTPPSQTDSDKEYMYMYI